MEEDRISQLSRLCQVLEHEFQDLSRLDTALRHSSWVHEHPGLGDSNERLEFLGDAVLELVVTEILFELFPDSPEGELSKARSGLVNEARLASLARELDLGSYLFLGKGEENQGGHDKASILADCLEAVTAALYLDGGLAAAQGFLRRLVAEEAHQAVYKAPRKDYKTRLQEVVQESLHLTPRYHLVAATGPDHDKTFEVGVEIDGRSLATGVGKSKKEAEQDAARQGLAVWESGEAGPPRERA
ncbi:MAG: ribonuclease III [Deltaproteobacteria bacterium]|nr:ribonuclease III [Deltaproteobacteria bacterium]